MSAPHPPWPWGVALASALWIALPTTGWSADPFKGKDQYTKNCRRCHGEKGDAQFAGVPNLNWRSGNQSGLLKPDTAILTRIQNGKNACPSFRGILADRDLLDIIAHMRVAYQ